MKYWRLLAALALVVVLGIIILFFLFQNSAKTPSTAAPTVNPFADVTAPQSSDSSSISTFVVSCYKTYITWYAANSQSATPEQSIPDPSQCFTTDFINQWPGIIASTEGDPVILAQDYGNSWITDASAVVNAQSQTDASVILNLGTGSELKQLFVDLQFTPSGWRISSVTSPQ